MAEILSKVEEKVGKLTKRGIVSEFKEFVNRGNVVDVAVAFVMGAAFKTVVDSFAGSATFCDMIKNGEIELVFTTVDETRTAIADSRSIRTTAQANRITYYTTISGAKAAVAGIKAIDQLEVYDLQGLHASL